jgi:hypothetical protein
LFHIYQFLLKKGDSELPLGSDGFICQKPSGGGLGVRFDLFMQYTPPWYLPVCRPVPFWKVAGRAPMPGKTAAWEPPPQSFQTETNGPKLADIFIILPLRQKSTMNEDILTA